MNWHHHRHHHSDEPTSALYLITPPAAVVSQTEMKAHLRVDDDDNNETIDAVTAAATLHLDGRDGCLGRALADQTWELRLSWFPGCGFVRIPLPPLIEVLSIKYIDAHDAEQTFDPVNYLVVGEGDRGRVFLRSGKSWPVLGAGQPEGVKIRFRAGYVDGSVSPPAAAVPAPIIAAIKLLTATLYENRESVVIGQTAIELPWAAKALLQPYWIPGS